MAWRVVPPASHGIPRVPRYSGYSSLFSVFAYRTITFFGKASQPFLLRFSVHVPVQTPTILLSLVWPLPLSLATTHGISVDYSSSPYLDVSVQAVPFCNLWIQLQISYIAIREVSPFGNLRVDGYLLLTAAYRSLSRPSSAPSAKASSLCSS